MRRVEQLNKSRVRGTSPTRRASSLALVRVMKHPLRIAAFVLLAVGLAACAAGSPEAHQATAGGPIALLALGFWHGIIAPVTLIVEIINTFAPAAIPVHWHMYQASADSMPYDVGFYFGLAGGPTFLFSRRR